LDALAVTLNEAVTKGTEDAKEISTNSSKERPSPLSRIKDEKRQPAAFLLSQCEPNEQKIRKIKNSLPEGFSREESIFHNAFWHLTLGSFKPSLVGWIHYDPKWHSSG
jgi:hypothetical protein